MQRLVVIGASLGGLTTLRTILQGLATTFSAPIAIVQHRHKESKTGMTKALQLHSPLPIREVEDKDAILPGYVYLAPADYHLLVEPDHFVLSVDEPVSYARPSIDVLFESAAESYAEQTIGVILTGANQDGALGASAIKAQGGTIIVQEPTTATSAVMPTAALNQTTADWVLPPTQIARRLNALCSVSSLT
ncbi:MAG: chemotaxis protein CheB [Cyanobacteria bacterium RM1_2_2]|nr:chemotaxis protein CheB [Cyanobacteria bacterium RM1_2_2]